MKTKSSTVVVACRKCGHEWSIEREALLSGSWQRGPCPVCGTLRMLQTEEEVSHDHPVSLPKGEHA